MSVIKYNNVQDAIMNADSVTICFSSKEYTIVKRESTLETPEGFEKTKIKILINLLKISTNGLISVMK